MILEPHEGVAIRFSRSMIFGYFNVGNWELVEELVKHCFIHPFVQVADKQY